jgi:anti-sigma factor RsiW
MDRIDPWLERLSEYLDGELDETDRAAIEAHLRKCAVCRATLEDLRVVVGMAARLEDRPPERDLWAGIAARIGAAGPAAGTTTPPAGPTVVDLAERRGRTPRRFSFTLPQLAAAAITLMLASGAIVRVATRVDPGAPRVAGADAAPQAGPAAGAPIVRTVANFGGPTYDAAVAELERVLQEGRERLDPATIQVLEANLAIIDRAIEEARRAVEADPANAFLNNHLADNMRRKLDLLRQATAIVRAQT